jgi:hypothetical protein
MHFLLPICGKFTRALLAHQIFFIVEFCRIYERVVVDMLGDEGCEKIFLIE